MLSAARTTLAKHFKQEIAAGEVKLKARMGKFLVAVVEGRDLPGLKPIDSDQVRGTLLTLFMKAHMGWRETSVHEHANPVGVGNVVFARAWASNQRPTASRQRITR